MSRSIDISHRDAAGVDTAIRLESGWTSLGGQRSSMHFWALPRLREIGIERLARLGVSDPATFFGWDDLAVLRRELTLLDAHLAELDFHLETQVEWLCRLLYCYHTLVGTTPAGSTPIFSIG